MEKITVIIPIFNGEKYIKNIVQMLNKQSFRDFNVIFVDDYSKDNTLKILKEEKKNSTFDYEVIKSNKKGVGSARNTGIEKATGEYIVFIDVDDYFFSSYLEKLYFKLTENDFDIVLSNYQNKNISNEIVDVMFPFEDEILENEQIKEKLIYALTNENIYGECIAGVVWRSIFKCSFLKDNNIKFDENSPIGEDLLFVLDCYSKTNKIGIVKDCLYCYDSSIQSTLKRKDNDFFQKQKKYAKLLKDNLERNKIDLVKANYYAYYFYILYSLPLSKGAHLSSSEFKNEINNCYNEFKKDEKVIYCKDGLSFKKKIIFYLYKFNLKFMLYILYKQKEKC